MHIVSHLCRVVVMSELEIVERQYRELSTKVIYSGFDGTATEDDKRRLEELSDRRLRLSAPDLESILAAAV